MDMQKASQPDCSLLATLNHQLIRDEGHRNSMTVDQLTIRMESWLATDYAAYIVRLDAEPTGYALFRTETEFIYLRQFFVHPDFRRRGIGSSAFQWLNDNIWHNELVRIDVLCANNAGIAFWRSMGFDDYCITMERG